MERTSSRKWFEQFRRVKRWYTRFKSMDEGRPDTLTLDDYLDEVYAFFQNCYHLKDWIKNDDSININPKTVEDFVKNHQDLRICRDICNSTKHLELRSKKKKPEVVKRNIYLKLSAPETPKISIKYGIDTNGGEKDAFELATKCLHAWQTFLESHNVDI